ncbi:MAG: NADAR family protein [Gammaproteobacteria bacterium]|nr:NADAR family protein [Gammaproteobacteria bacterium]
MPPPNACRTSPKCIDRFIGEYAFLSNFHRASFAWAGVEWTTAEHAFQASKTLDDEQRERVRIARSPGAAKRLGRRVDLRPDWEDVKDDLMLEVLEAKYAVPELRAGLLATGDAVLIEGNTWGDRYWGVCDGRGRNQLGVTLMRIREYIRRDHT